MIWGLRTDQAEVGKDVRKLVPRSRHSWLLVHQSPKKKNLQWIRRSPGSKMQLLMASRVFLFTLRLFSVGFEFLKEGLYFGRCLIRKRTSLVAENLFLRK